MKLGPFLLWFILVSLLSSSCLGDDVLVGEGSNYLLSAVVLGDDYYLGCGDDYKCGMVSIASAQEHDGWSLRAVSGASDNIEYGFLIRNDLWALDVDGSSGANSLTALFANPTINLGNLDGQSWALTLWPDGAYAISNEGWGGYLDLWNGGSSIFLNSVTDDASLLGQHWYFRSVSPQTTITTTTLSVVVNTFTINAEATSTTTATITTCLSKRSIGETATVSPRLQKRGAEILDTTTQTSTVTRYSTDTTTITQTSSTGILTNTETVISCAPITTTLPPSTIISEGSTITNAPITITAPGVTVTPDITITPGITITSGGGNNATGVQAASSSATTSTSAPIPAPSPSKVWIAGAVAGPVVGLALLALGVLLFLHRRRRNDESREPVAFAGSGGLEPLPQYQAHERGYISPPPPMKSMSPRTLSPVMYNIDTSELPSQGRTQISQVRTIHMGGYELSGRPHGVNRRSELP